MAERDPSAQAKAILADRVGVHIQDIGNLTRQVVRSSGAEEVRIKLLVRNATPFRYDKVDT